MNEKRMIANRYEMFSRMLFLVECNHDLTLLQQQLLTLEVHL